MKKIIFALCLTTPALTAGAQDLPVNSQMPPPMAVPMRSLGPGSISPNAPIVLSTPIAATAPSPSSANSTDMVMTTPSSAINPAEPGSGDNNPGSLALTASLPPGLPAVVIAQAIPCNVDMAYRKKNQDCAVSVLRGVLAITDLGSLPEANLEDARVRSGSYSFGKNFADADQDFIDGVSLMQSGNWGDAHLKMADGYAEIKRLTQMSDDEKSSVRCVLEFSEALDDLSRNDTAGASLAFIRSYQDAQDPGTEAAAMFAEAQTEIDAQHPDRALHLLTHAYSQAGPNLRSSILLAKVGVLASLNGSDNAAIDASARAAIENAEGGQQKAFATLLYAALVHNSDPARAKQLLDDAEALCNSDADWARNQKQAIEQYRQAWGS